MGIKIWNPSAGGGGGGGGGGGSVTPTEFNCGNSGSAYTFDVANGENQRLMLTTNATLTLPTPSLANQGYRLSLQIQQDAVGSRLPTFSPLIKGTMPTFTTTRYRIDRLELYCNGYDWQMRAYSLGLIDSAAPWAPFDISGIQLWLDGSDSSTMTTSGAFISQWRDKSGVGNHMSQPTGTNQPSLATGVQNGKSAVLFDGVDDWVSGAIASNPNDYTAIYVLRNTRAVSSVSITGYMNRIGDSGGPNLEDHGIWGTAGAAGKLFWHQNGTTGGNSTTLMSQDVNRVVFFERSGSSKKIYVAGVVESTISQARTTTNFNLILGTNTAWAFKGYFMDVIYYNRALTTPEQTLLLNYFTTKWGV